MRNGNTAGFFTVIGEISLRVQISFIIDDGHGLLVGAHRTVRTQAPELALNGPLGQHIRHTGLRFQRSMVNIIIDGHGKIVLGVLRRQVVINSHNISRYSILGGQAVTTADNLHLTVAVIEGSTHILIQRVAHAAADFYSVQHGHALNSFGQHGKHIFRRKRAVHTHLQEANLLTLRAQIIHRLISNLADRTHGNHNIGSLRVTVIIKGMICTAGSLAYLLHIFSHNRRQLHVLVIAGFSGLENNIRVLRRALNGGMLGIQCAVTEFGQRVIIHHTGQLVIIPQLNLLLLMRCAEAVKEVHKRHTALNGRQMCHRRQIHGLLHIGRANHGKTRLGAGHNVAMVTKNGQSVSGQRTGRNVHYTGQKLAGNTIHIGNHQQQTLRGRKSGSQCTRSQNAVECTCRTALRLHFGNRNGLPKDIFTPCCLPLIHIFCHGGRRRNRIDSCNIGKRISHISSGLITVHCCLKLFFCHNQKPIPFLTLKLKSK